MKPRLMRKDDLPDVLTLYGTIYSNWIEKGANRKISVPDTAIKTLSAYLEADPKGCFVIEEEKISGFAFSHHWGGLGWLGPVGVVERERGRGYGKMLTRSCVGYLSKYGCSTIGLETVSAENIGLYMRLGFLPILPRVRFFKKVANREMPKATALLSSEPSVKTAHLRRICVSLERGLDFTHEMKRCEERGIGTTVLVKKSGEVARFAFLQTMPSREEKRPLALIKMLAIRPEYSRRNLLFRLLDACEALARREGRREISIKVYSGYSRLMCDLLAYEYAVQSSTLRMVLKGTYAVKRDAYCGYAWSS